MISTIDAAAPINWDHSLARGLISWWRVVPEWSGGTLLHDLTGLNPGTYMGDMQPPTQTSGPNAPQFRGSFGEVRMDGSDDEVRLSGPLLGTSDTGTLVCRFRVVTTGLYAFFARVDAGGVESTQLFCGGNSTGAYTDESLGFVTTTSSVQRLSMFVRKGTDFYNDNREHWIAVIVDGRDNRILIDGSRQTVSFAAGSATSRFFLNTVDTNSAAIGRRFITASPLYLNGAVDDILLYNRGISNEEALQLYQDSTVLLRRIKRYYSLPLAAGGFLAAWAAQRSGLIGGGVR